MLSCCIHTHGHTLLVEQDVRNTWTQYEAGTTVFGMGAGMIVTAQIWLIDGDVVLSVNCEVPGL